MPERNGEIVAVVHHHIFGQIANAVARRKSLTTPRR
jgi:hypothetical protein